GLRASNGTACRAKSVGALEIAVRTHVDVSGGRPRLATSLRADALFIRTPAVQRDEPNSRSRHFLAGPECHHIACEICKRSFLQCRHFLAMLAMQRLRPESGLRNGHSVEWSRKLLVTVA